MISIYYGTRPEYIKVYLLYKRLRELSVPVELVKVIQHTDLISEFYSDRSVKIEELYGYTNRLNSIVSSVLNDTVVPPYTKLVVIQGDTATAFAVALNAFNKQIPVAHIEAGLRTHDIENPFPEEAYRRCISAMSSYHFCVSEIGLNHLNSEVVCGEKHIVGNTVLDALSKHETSIVYGDIVLVTLHRRENKEQMRKWFEELEQIAKQNSNLKFLLPMHPSINSDIYSQILHTVQVVKPLSHGQIIELLKECRFVITDSGGIQEESSFFKKKSIVCRKKTEREEGLGNFSTLCESPNKLSECVNSIVHDFVINKECPYGDGNSVDKIAKILMKASFKNEKF
jgi:UDP-N-acetylglucosamine 2-epimerase (non-hydrolysing)